MFDKPLERATKSLKAIAAKPEQITNEQAKDLMAACLAICNAKGLNLQIAESSSVTKADPEAVKSGALAEHLESGISRTSSKVHTSDVPDAPPLPPITSMSPPPPPPPPPPPSIGTNGQDKPLTLQEQIAKTKLEKASQSTSSSTIPGSSPEGSPKKPSEKPAGNLMAELAAKGTGGLKPTVIPTKDPEPKAADTSIAAQAAKKRQEMAAKGGNIGNLEKKPQNAPEQVDFRSQLKKAPVSHTQTVAARADAAKGTGGFSK